MARQQLVGAASGSELYESESSRLEALDRYDLLDSAPEPAFNRIVRLIRNIFDLPIGIVSVIDGHRQWYKAFEGLSDNEVGLNDTFCRCALYDPNGLFVSDATRDFRFADSPFVTEAPHIRSYAGAPLRTSDGHNIGTICAIGTQPRQFTDRERQILVDLAQITMDEMELRLKATTDWLTGAMTRRAFTEAGTRLHSQSLRHALPLGVIALDIDHFKRINDTYGHAAGDAVLREVAQVCRGQLRESDTFGRIGGEEFAILLPHANKTNAAELADKLRHAIAALRVKCGTNTIQITASFGVSELSLSSLDLDTLIGQADTALYSAKSGGRNRVVLWDSAQLSASDVRRRVLKAGRIVYSDGNFTVDCTIRSLSDRSAGIDVMSSSDLPDRFKLFIPSDRIERQCRLKVRGAKHIEVEFA
jgi:diguanylate cyclase (GGDEF)-like protein